MSKLKVAVQKSGRLFDGSLKLLKDCGIKISNGRDQLKAEVPNFPMELLFLRNSDIPQYISDGVADIAIIGENTLVEKSFELESIEKLGFSKCRLSLAVPKNTEVTGMEWFNGKKIATSYPRSLKKFLKENSLEAEIHKISGSVEIAPNIGLADAICDLVSSGNTLFNNGLKEVEIILRSEAVLVANPNLDEGKKAIVDQLLTRIQSVLLARDYKYILMNIANEKIQTVTELLPVLKSPTILPLAEPGWSSLHSVIREDALWDSIEKLKSAGAQDILVNPIEKLVR